MKQLSGIGKLAVILFFLSVMGLVIGLQQCRTSDAIPIGLEPIRSDMDIPFAVYEVDASTDTTITTSTGTSLTFLSGMLVTKRGEIVKGNVQVKVREFHDANAILQAGIPMRLRSDRNAFLQSSGMLEIRAFQNGEELAVGAGKTINTDLAAYRSSKDHQLYFLRDNSDWETSDTFITKTNTRKQHRLRDILQLKNAANKKTQVKDIVLELYGDEDETPELAPWRG
ncbi:MAG: hypothetical protein FJX80_00650 [Bacteroidetes bacterium]|nr:hypothetical protein [Bacteroidota bacterium]